MATPPSSRPSATDRATARPVLQAVLALLRESPLAERMRIFGSVAAGDEWPGDIDCVVDLDPAPWTGVVARAHWSATASLRDLPPTATEAVAALLELARDPEVAGRLDLFVRHGGVLLVPTAARTWWVPSPVGLSVWARAFDRGVPVAAIDRLPYRPAAAPDLGGAGRGA